MCVADSTGLVKPSQEEGRREEGGTQIPSGHYAAVRAPGEAGRQSECAEPGSEHALIASRVRFRARHTHSARCARREQLGPRAAEVRDPLFLHSSLLNSSLRRSSLTRFSGYRAPSAPPRPRPRPAGAAAGSRSTFRPSTKTWTTFVRSSNRSPSVTMTSSSESQKN